MSGTERIKRFLSEHSFGLSTLAVTLFFGTFLMIAYYAGKIVERVDEQDVVIEQVKRQQEDTLRWKGQFEAKLGDLKCEIRENSLARFAAECIEDEGELRFEGLYCLFLSVGDSVPFEDPLPDIQRNC